MGVLSLDLQQTDAGNDGGAIRRLEQAIEREEVERKAADLDLASHVNDERAARQGADTEIWQEINTIEAASDVVDVVGTYADLQNYDTSKLTNNDLIKVLQDATHGDAITYYRWDSSAFVYVGAEGPYYTTAETDALVNGKQDKIIAGSNIQIAADGKTISATDTTYSAGQNIQINPGNVISATDTKYSAGVGLLLEGSEFAVDTSVVAELSDIPSQTSDLVNNGSDGLSTYVEADELATVATSGSYNDLTNKPTIPAAQIQSDWTQSDTSAVDYIKNKPTIPAPYVLPPATASDLGGIIVGTNLSVDSDGVLSAVDTTYTAGNNVQINNNVISATNTTYGVFDDDTDGLTPGPTSAEISAGKFLKADGTWDIPATASYTAGNGISIDANNEISADTTVLATQTDLAGKQDALTAGGNIQINNNVISATDTTYSVFTTDLNGLVPGPSAAEVSAGDKFLKADGSWTTVQTDKETVIYTLTTVTPGDYANGVLRDSNNNRVFGIGVYNDYCAGKRIVFRNGATLYDVIWAGDNDEGEKYFTIAGPGFPGGKMIELAISDYSASNPDTVYEYSLQRTLTAGSNVQINQNTGVISATNTTYTAGTGINISAHNVISATGVETVEYSYLGTPGTSTYPNGLLRDSNDDRVDGWTLFQEIQDGKRVVLNADYYTYFEVISANYDDEARVTIKYIDPFTAPDRVYTAQITCSVEQFPNDYLITTEVQPKLTAGSNITISGNTISATDTTYSNFTGATASVAGAAGLVPAPSAGDEGKALLGDGTWGDATAKLVEMSYGESNAWAKFIAAYNAGSIVYCRASSNSNPASGSQTRKAFMAYVNNATSPTSVEFQYVRSVSSKTDSQQCDQVFVYTLTNASGGTWSVASRNMAPKINVNGPITKTFSNGANATVTIGANAMTGATSSAAGAAGIVPKPNSGDEDKVLTGAGTWAKVGNDNIDWSTTSIASAPTIISTTTDYITMESGYSVQYNNVYTLGKIVIMNLVVKSDSGFPNGSQVNVGALTSAFRPAYNNINTYVGLGDEWACPEVGYCYISAGNGKIHIRSDTDGKTFARLNLVYVRV